MATILSEGTVRAIRRALVEDPVASRASLARDYGVHEATIAAAAYGRTWRGITDPPPLPPPPPTGRTPANTVLTARRVRRARLRYLDGEPLSEIARRYGVTDATIRAAIHGVSWAAVDNPGPVPIQKVGRRPPALTEDEISQARALRAGGMTYTAIGEALGAHRVVVWRALGRGQSAE